MLFSSDCPLFKAFFFFFFLLVCCNLNTHVFEAVNYGFSFLKKVSSASWFLCFMESRLRYALVFLLIHVKEWRVPKMMAQLGAGELRCGDQVESWPFLGSLQSARLWVVFLGCLSASPEKERLAPRRAGVCGVAAPGGWAGRSRGLGRRALFPWPRPPVSVYFLPLSLRLTSPCGLWSLLSSAKVEEDRPLLVPASVEETHSSISQVFQRTWKAGTLTSPACLPWTLSFSFHCFAWS